MDQHAFVLSFPYAWCRRGFKPRNTHPEVRSALTGPRETDPLVGTTNVNASCQYRSHYYPVFGPGQSPGITPFVNLTRQLYTRPTIATVDLGLSYSRKIRGRTLSTQGNIQNAFNHDKLLFPPNPTAATAPFVTA